MKTPWAYSVYVHDTPSRNLFERTQRAFSSGCVRVERPFELAEALMNNPEKWSRERFLEIRGRRRNYERFFDGADTRSVALLDGRRGLDGYLHFRPNVYERDQAILERLNGEFRVRSRPVVAPPSK